MTCPGCGWKHNVYRHGSRWLAVVCGWCGIEIAGIAYDEEADREDA